jgi:hypothetical protein
MSGSQAAGHNNKAANAKPQWKHPKKHHIKLVAPTRNLRVFGMVESHLLASLVLLTQKLSEHTGNRMRRSIRAYVALVPRISALSAGNFVDQLQK